MGTKGYHPSFPSLVHKEVMKPVVSRIESGWFSTKLLVSVIDSSECGALLACPPAVVDIKNPADGSLGMPDTKTISEVRRLIRCDIPLSVAIGDATDDAAFYLSRAASAERAGADFIKVGLFDFESAHQEEVFLSRLRRGISASLVAVWYADLLKRPLDELPAIAASAGAHGCLIDTYRKDGGALTDYATLPEIESFIEACRKVSVFSAVAGSLQEDDIGWIQRLRPDIAGFRGAVASGKRDEPGLDAERLSFFRGSLGEQQITAESQIHK